MAREKPSRMSCFMMHEMICGVMVFGVVSVSFVTVLSHMRSAEARLAAEQRALLVLDNTLERIRSLARFNEDDVREIFDEERCRMFDSGGLIPAHGIDTLEDSLLLYFADSKSGRVISRARVRMVSPQGI